MYFRLFFLILIACCRSLQSSGQTITNGDGSPLTTRYCYNNTDYALTGQPAGGVLSGCGVSLSGGTYYFNPVTATAGISVFPYSCPLTYTVGGSSVTRNILVWKPVVITPPLKDFFTCDGSFRLQATTLYAGDYDYTWTPGAFLDRPDSPATNGFIPATQMFVLTARDVTSDCMGSDTVVITKASSPVITVSNDTVISAGQKVKLQASGADRYQWSPDQWLDNSSIAMPTASPKAPITYRVIGSNEQGCTDTGEVFVDIREALFLPNAFSPNGDGINDVFRIENYGYQEVKEFRIFNRWGQVIFETKDGSKGWNGYQDGIPVETGSYCYYIRLILRDETIKVFKGDIALIR